MLVLMLMLMLMLMPMLMLGGGLGVGTGCKAADLDLSPGAFEKLADMGRGRVGVTWAWLEVVPTG